MDRIKWTKDKIKQELISVIDELHINRMPTRKEIISVKHDDRLTNKISKTLGYYGWAKELGLQVKDNDTNRGKKAEYFAKELLETLGFKVDKMLQNFAYDLLVDDVCKIDVKYSNLYKGKAGNFFSFALRKKYPTCDFYMLIADDNNNQQKVFIVPAHLCNQTQISIGQYSSKYLKYLNKYSFIKEFVKDIKNIAI